MQTWIDYYLGAEGKVSIEDTILNAVGDEPASKIW